jgi:hypothetical protein
MNEMEIRALVSRMEPTCWLCKWIREDLDTNGKLTGYPFDYNGGATFPVDGKLKHLRLEESAIENRLTEPPF